MIIGLYKPPNLKDDEFLSNLSDALNTFSISYNHITLIGDFNMTPENKSLTYFNNSSNFQHLISEPTCFKSIKPSQIDHILTNHKKSFMKSSTMETGISDFHKMIFTIIKYTFTKGKAKTLYYRNLKNINQSDFNSRLKQNINENDLNFDSLCSAIKESLNFFAPLKKKKVRHNNNKFMTKHLRKAIMNRSRLRNKYNKNRTNENWSNYARQRNLCVKILKKSKKHYF